MPRWMAVLTYALAAVLAERAGMPAGQEATGTTTESDHSAWVRPSDLLARHAAGEVRMLPPTVVSLEQLAEFGSAVLEGRAPATDGQAGLRVMGMLEAAQRSLQFGGTFVPLERQP